MVTSGIDMEIAIERHELRRWAFRVIVVLTNIMNDGRIGLGGKNNSAMLAKRIALLRNVNVS
jgi:hypothetical protein